MWVKLANIRQTESVCEFFSQSYLGHKHAAQCHSCTEADTEAHRDDFVVGTKVDGYKGQPDNTGGVHGKGNVLSFIEIGRDIAGLYERENKNSENVCSCRNCTVNL